MKEKERVRAAFRDAVFKRAGFRCQGLGCAVRATRADAERVLDAHHITDRALLPAGGYVPENGIALCAECHRKAEAFHSTGKALEGWSPDDLYQIIDSSHDRALAASQRRAGQKN